MDNIESYVNDLMILFRMDLLNKFVRVDNSVVVIMEDGSQVRVQVKRLA